MTNQIPPADKQKNRWAELRAALHKNDIDTYYAVHSDGHSQGWSGLTLMLTERIKKEQDEFRRIMHDNDDEIESAKLRGKISGLQSALQFITELNN
jgi:CRISPR/Cas system CSM-associated protein Csm2 small subunit